jgi:hypothetical protein
MAADDFIRPGTTCCALFLAAWAGCAACGGTTVEPAMASPVDNDRGLPPAQTLASDQCSSSVAGATVGVDKTDAGERVVDVKLGPQELSGPGCRGRRTSGTVTSD